MDKSNYEWLGEELRSYETVNEHATRRHNSLSYASRDEIKTTITYTCKHFEANKDTMINEMNSCAVEFQSWASAFKNAHAHIDDLCLSSKSLQFQGSVQLVDFHKTLFQRVI